MQSAMVFDWLEHSRFSLSDPLHWASVNAMASNYT